MKYILSLLLVIVVALFFGRKFFDRTEMINGSQAPEFTAELIDGSSFELEDLAGKYVLIDFWGSWCPPCRKENPKLVALYNKYKDSDFKSGDGFDVITVALEKNDRTWRKVAEAEGFTWKNQIVEISRYVLLSSLAQSFGVTDLPAKFLISPKGEIIGSNLSFIEMDRMLSERITD